MKVACKARDAAREGADLLVAFAAKKDGEVPVRGLLARLDGELGGAVAALIDGGDFEGKREEVRVLAVARGEIRAKRLAVVGLGDAAKIDAEALRRAAAAAMKAASAKVEKVVIALEDLPAGVDRAEAAQALVEGAQLASYRFSRFKKAAAKKPAGVSAITLMDGEGGDAAALKRGAARGEAVAAGVALARDLGNLPGNHGQPRVLADEARKMARREGLSCSVMGPAQMKKAGMGSLLSVALGSTEEPRLIVLEHNAGKKGLPTICIVGKGLTFDSGGISLKPGADMDKMRYDKCGGCAVIGAMLTAARLALPIHLVGIVPSSENMPGPSANKPGDVVRAADGTTIEILNTDAEGRLILADALLHAQTFEPEAIVDLATLTGACMIALGQHCCGLMSRHDELAAELEAAGRRSHERAWRLPLWDEHVDEMKGATTDLKNLGGRYGGALTAGAFLSNFVGERPWAHLDIAGVSWDDPARPYAKGSGATGFGVRLITEWLSARAEGGSAGAGAAGKAKPKGKKKKAARKKVGAARRAKAGA